MIHALSRPLPQTATPNIVVTPLDAQGELFEAGWRYSPQKVAATPCATAEILPALEEKGELIQAELSQLLDDETLGLTGSAIFWAPVLRSHSGTFGAFRCNLSWP